MTGLLSLTTVVCWGVWIPLAQTVRGISQRTRAFYAATGNLVLASVAFLIDKSTLSVTWRGFWLPFAGGIVWTAGSLCAFRATQLIGLARAAGSWAPLNIFVSFVWGAALFGELSGLSPARWATLGAGVILVLAGVTVVVRSRDEVRVGVQSRVGGSVDGATPGPGLGFMYAVVAGLLWGSYFVPAQWAKVPAQVGNLPLALGIFAAGVVLVLRSPASLRLPLRVSAVQLVAGALFGVGDLALLALVSRLGTGTGYTIAQLSLLANAAIGIWIFKVPVPRSAAAHRVLVGIVVAGGGGCLIGALH